MTPTENINEIVEAMRNRTTNDYHIDSFKSLISQVREEAIREREPLIQVALAYHHAKDREESKLMKLKLIEACANYEHREILKSSTKQKGEKIMDFKPYCQKPQRVSAVQYARDGANKKVLLEHTMIQEVPNSIKLRLAGDDTFVEPGDWIVKLDGDFFCVKDNVFKERFFLIEVGVQCTHCGKKFESVKDVSAHAKRCKERNA